jgi:hypothetical protein
MGQKTKNVNDGVFGRERRRELDRVDVWFYVSGVHEVGEGVMGWVLPWLPSMLESGRKVCVAPQIFHMRVASTGKHAWIEFSVFGRHEMKSTFSGSFMAWLNYTACCLPFHVQACIEPNAHRVPAHIYLKSDILAGTYDLENPPIPCLAAGEVAMFAMFSFPLYRLRHFHVLAESDFPNLLTKVIGLIVINTR